MVIVGITLRVSPMQTALGDNLRRTQREYSTCFHLLANPTYRHLLVRQCVPVNRGEVWVFSRLVCPAGQISEPLGRIGLKEPHYDVSGVLVSSLEKRP